jgi:hypothetical protein
MALRGLLIRASTKSFEREDSMLIMSMIRASALAAAIIVLCCSALARQRGTLPAHAAGKGAAGIDVTLEQVTGGRRTETKTDEAGNFSFSNVEAGTYKLRIGCAVVTGSEELEAEVARHRGDQRCRAEMLIVMTYGSKGDIKGSVGKGD